ncbi:MAG: hypothetical protein H0U78_00145 [Rickettsiaceae bacterium]|nr:hypothetical protein [Rickettsiaceae bacterium]
MKGREEEKQKSTQVQGVKQEIFPELNARIDDLLPELEVAVRAGDAEKVAGIIQQYDEYVAERYSEHEAYDFTPTIQIRLQDYLGNLAHTLGFHEISYIFEYEPAPEMEEEIFPELNARIDDLLPTLEVAVRAGDVEEVAGIIQLYDEYVAERYSEHEAYDITPNIENRLQDYLGDLAHTLGFHNICGLFEYEACQLSGAE